MFVGCADSKIVVVIELFGRNPYDVTDSMRQHGDKYEVRLTISMVYLSL